MSHLAAPFPVAAFRTPRSGYDFFLTDSHSRSVAERIVAALGDERALVVVTGDPAPRAPALAQALGIAAQSRYRVIAMACNPELSRDMLMEAASAHPQPAPSASIAQEASAPARAGLAAPLFLLDGAERLSDAQIAAIAEPAVGAVALLAQAGFPSRLETRFLVSVKQRLAATLAFQELGDDETEAFIRHQLGSGAGEGAFSTDIVAAIAAAAGGDPKLVNLLARLVLDYAARTGMMLPRKLFARAPNDKDEKPPDARDEAPDVAAFLAAPAAGAAPAEAAPAESLALKRRLAVGPLVVLASIAGLGLVGGGAMLWREGQRPPRPEIQARAPASLSAAEIATLLRRGDEFFASGDLASARLFYERAAAAGNRRAALRLAESYDPLFLRRAGVRGVPGDSRLARKWYRRARAMATTDAAPAAQGGVAPMIKP